MVRTTRHLNGGVKKISRPELEASIAHVRKLSAAAAAVRKMRKPPKYEAVEPPPPAYDPADASSPK